MNHEVTKVVNTSSLEMNELNIIMRLRRAMGESKAIDAVMHVFAARERARADVTIGSLSQRMKKEGYAFNYKEYEQVLRFLAELGFGTLEFDPKGRIIALREVRVALQSIGRVAIGQSQHIERFQPRNKFEQLQSDSEAPKTEADKAWEGAPSISAKLTVSLTINDKVVQMEIPPDLNPAELTALLAKISGPSSN